MKEVIVRTLGFLVGVGTVAVTIAGVIAVITGFEPG